MLTQNDEIIWSFSACWIGIKTNNKKDLDKKEKSRGMTEDESTSQEIAARLARLEQENADLRDQLANLQTNRTEQPTLASVSLSLTHSTETALSLAQSTPSQQ